MLKLLGVVINFQLSTRGIGIVLWGRREPPTALELLWHYAAGLPDNRAEYIRVELGKLRARRLAAELLPYK